MRGESGAGGGWTEWRTECVEDERGKWSVWRVERVEDERGRWSGWRVNRAEGGVVKN